MLFRLLSSSSSSHMADAVCFSCVNSISRAAKKSTSISAFPITSIISLQNPFFHLHHATSSRFHSIKAKGDEVIDKNNKNKLQSIVCEDCGGNGAILCSQCKGTGVNSVDFFNGQFKAGAECWLCSGRREMLCGNCNGAGFLGGFMSTSDETSS